MIGDLVKRWLMPADEQTEEAEPRSSEAQEQPEATVHDGQGLPGAEQAPWGMRKQEAEPEKPPKRSLFSMLRNRGMKRPTQRAPGNDGMSRPMGPMPMHRGPGGMGTGGPGQRVPGQMAQGEWGPSGPRPTHGFGQGQMGARPMEHPTAMGPGRMARPPQYGGDMMVQRRPQSPLGYPPASQNTWNRAPGPIRPQAGRQMWAYQPPGRTLGAGVRGGRPTLRPQPGRRPPLGPPWQ
ncbi:MAG: hypothetical protein OWT28_00595 [Firmicutes bacterium]|nr:hypothetical protein [Bacillota bacterium]